MPVEMPTPTQEKDTNDRGNSYAIINSAMPEGKGINIVLEGIEKSYADIQKKKHLLDDIEIETKKLTEFYQRYLKREFTLHQAMAVTAEKLNLFINILEKYATHYQLDTKEYLQNLVAKNIEYCEACKKVDFNHFNWPITLNLITIRNCLSDLQRDINDQLKSANLPADAQQYFENYFKLMMDFQYDGASRMDIYARPNPGMINQAEIKQEDILVRARQMLGL